MEFEAWSRKYLEDDPKLSQAVADANARFELLGCLVEDRKRVGLLQKDVAEYMETSQSAISELEGGATDPRLSTLQRYARAVGSRLVTRVVIDGVPEQFNASRELESRQFELPGDVVARVVNLPVERQSQLEITGNSMSVVAS